MTSPPPSPSLIRLLARVHGFRAELLAGKLAAIGDIARREHLARFYVARLLRLAFLAPDVTSAMLEGRQLAALMVTRLLKASKVPLDWQAQRQALGYL